MLRMCALKFAGIKPALHGHSVLQSCTWKLFSLNHGLGKIISQQMLKLNFKICVSHFSPVSRFSSHAGISSETFSGCWPTSVEAWSSSFAVAWLDMKMG